MNAMPGTIIAGETAHPMVAMLAAGLRRFATC
jgi:hypothetical protein